MNKWQYQAETVKAFIKGGKPGYALAAIIVGSSPAIIVSLLAVLKIVGK